MTFTLAHRLIRVEISVGLVSRYKKVFGASLVKKGEALLDLRTLVIHENREDRLSAEIWVEDDCYEVCFWVKKNTLETSCTCQKKRNKPCGHLWAALLWAEEFEALKKGAGRGVRFAGTAAANSEKAKASPGLYHSPKENIELHKPCFSIPNQGSLGSGNKELIFIVNASQSISFEKICFDLFWHPSGDKSQLKAFDPLSSLDDLCSIDFSLLEKFKGISTVLRGQLFARDTPQLVLVLEALMNSGRLYTRRSISQKQFKKVKEKLSTEIYCDVTQNEDGNYFAKMVLGNLASEDILLFMTGMAIGNQVIIENSNERLKDLVLYLWENSGVVPAWEAEEFLEKKLLPSGLKLDRLPGRLQLDVNDIEPKGHLFVKTATFKHRDKEQLHADLSFDYGGKIIPEAEEGEQVLNFYTGSLFYRKAAQEESLREELRDLSFRFNMSSHKEEFGWKVLPVRLPEIVDTLVRKDWLVIAEGKSYTAPQSFQLRLSSGSDWFDLEGEAVYGDKVLPLAELAKESSQGNQIVRLGDGNYGVLPEDWLKYYTVLTQLGEIVGDNLRFRKSQALIIEKLLFDKEESQNSDFNDFCQKLRSADKVKKAKEPIGFKGELRPYQQQGLAWMQFLGRNGFSGILADDMGLGKTVQVLALLQHEINKGQQSPSLLIVPSSLVFNWAQEAQKFTPEMRLLQYVGNRRKGSLQTLSEIDLVITSYGTLRQDIELLAEIKFNYCILDEAQAIKNRDSSTAKAARLVLSEKKLSMSGTPVENSLSDLLSQFEFLNPGMTAYGRLSSILEDVKMNRETFKKIRDIFKPFILRRTKQEVAKELPPKIDQVIYCNMEKDQAAIYDRLWKWYRQELLEKEKKTPQAGKKGGIDYLGALTRLRQAACHPALISDEWVDIGSVKIAMLISKLEELMAEGQKVLIFSQYTSFLTLIREQIEAHKWKYCYLDGKTKDRAGEVETFQNNDAIKIFVISLKAGGVGLNLTKAEYVFIMDPWWNPAIENQAIDRAYRIGQKNTVVAQRFICRNTVEEKVLKMQQTKKYLADSIIHDDSEFSAHMSVDDLRSLLD